METFPQIIRVANQEKGLVAAKKILYERVNDKTLLFLSGGKTPKDLYTSLAKEKKLIVKAVGMVDERADSSNYKMIKLTGLLDYLENLKIKFFPILRTHLKGVKLNPESVAGVYNETVLKLVEKFKNKIAIVGIGEDGHTAGIPARIPHFAKASRGKQNSDYAIRIDDFPGEFKERITLTFKTLAEMDLLIILAFGFVKQNALKEMFSNGPIEEIPARFYAKPEIAKKTILITDQKI